MTAALMFCPEALTDGDHAGRPRARPGVSRLVEEAYAAGWRLVVASTAPYSEVETLLEHAVGFDRAKDFAVLAGPVVDKLKPAPDLYLLAMEELGVGAADVIVVESSVDGLAAALDAGIRTVVIADGDAAGLEPAALVLTCFGDDETAAEVLHDPLDLQITDVVSVKDLGRLLTIPRAR